MGLSDAISERSLTLRVGSFLALVRQIAIELSWGS